MRIEGKIGDTPSHPEEIASAVFIDNGGDVLVTLSELIDMELYKNGASSAVGWDIIVEITPVNSKKQKARR